MSATAFSPDSFQNTFTIMKLMGHPSPESSETLDGPQEGAA
jgi:hypothetical protein